jgi:hypothetical protein
LQEGLFFIIVIHDNPRRRMDLWRRKRIRKESAGTIPETVLKRKIPMAAAEERPI